MRGRLRGARCLVTGATGTLGSAIVHRFRAEGADLLLVGRSGERLDRLMDELGGAVPKGGTMQPLIADLAALDAVDRIATAVAANGGLDVLVNNAAIPGPIGPIWENDWTSWTETIRIDLLSPIALCRALVPWLGRLRRGKVVNISGGGATGPRPNFSAYAVAKAGLVRFTETFAHEVRERNIEVNAVAPGVFASAMTRAILAAGPERSSDREIALTREAMAADRAAALERAVGLCAWLASSASDGITGRLLAALWDPWDRLNEHAAEIAASDLYTLRRILPADRGKKWDR